MDQLRNDLDEGELFFWFLAESKRNLCDQFGMCVCELTIGSIVAPVTEYTLYCGTIFKLWDRMPVHNLKSRKSLFCTSHGILILNMHGPKNIVNENVPKLRYVYMNTFINKSPQIEVHMFSETQ